MRKIISITLLLLLTTGVAQAQCNILPTAVAGIILDYQSTNLLNCSGVGFNPILRKYYGVRAGNATYPLETWSESGVQLFTTTAGFDWRGMWWNPNTNQLEGNGYNTTGIWNCWLDGSGWATSSGNSIFTGMAQPDIQSVGDYDYFANEIIYYFSGSIYRYSRATNAFLGSFPVTGTPVALSNLNSNTVVFTGCPGKEIGLLDYINRRVYVYSKATGAYVGFSQLPSTVSTTSTFRFSWANGYAWFFNLSLGNWYSYRIFDSVVPVSSMSANAIWYTKSVAQINWESTLGDQFESFRVERSTDGSTYEAIGNVAASDVVSDNGMTQEWMLQDESAPRNTMVYYRVMAVLKSGETEYSDVMTLTSMDASDLGLYVYPVPADAAVSVQVQGIGDGASLDVTDLSGRLVHHAEGDDFSESTGGFQLATDAWADGVYLMRLRDGKGNQSTQRLVIQH